MKMSVSTEITDLEFLEIFQDQKLKERERQLSVYLKELRNYILRIIRVWSFFSIRVYLGLHFLPIILGH